MEQNKKNIKLVMILLAIALIIFNAYFALTKNYMTVTAQAPFDSDAKRETVVSVDYIDLNSREESISNAIFRWAEEEPMGEDSGPFEKAAIVLVFVGIAVSGLGLLLFLANRRPIILALGVFSSCIGAALLFYIKTAIETAIDESIVGTFESFLGKGTIMQISSTSGMMLFVNAALGIVICALGYFYMKNAPTTPPTVDNEPSILTQ